MEFAEKAKFYSWNITVLQLTQDIEIPKNGLIWPIGLVADFHKRRGENIEMGGVDTAISLSHPFNRLHSD